MTKSFYRQRIRDQWAYIAELHYRLDKKDITLERYNEVMISASGVMRNLKLQLKELCTCELRKAA